ncbi:MAG: hypothetical protein PHF00_11535 [Elusimicrobia bacterium]|nr:hypothetical protein [Elusimicrobiota bacterium]
MPSPSSTLATLRPDLSASLEEFDLAADRAGFIGLRALPVVDVARQAGTFGKIPIEQLLENRETKRAPGGGYARSEWTFTSASYACEEHGAEEPVDDREARMYADYFDAELVSAARALDVVLRNQEKRVADLLFDAATYTGASLTLAVTNEWDSNHKTDAVPLNDVEYAVQKVWDNTGLWPNAIVFNRKVFRALRNLDQIKDRIAAAGAGYPTRAADITVEQLAQCFDLPFVLVAGSAKNSANEGQDASIAQIWSDEYAWIGRIATSRDFREPCVGRVFHWTEDGSQVGGAVESYRDEPVRSDIVRVRHDVDEVVLYTECGFLLSNITTAA